MTAEERASQVCKAMETRMAATCGNALAHYTGQQLIADAIREAEKDALAQKVGMSRPKQADPRYAGKSFSRPWKARAEAIGLRVYVPDEECAVVAP